MMEIKTTTEGVDFDEVRDLLNGYGLSDLDSDTQRLVFERSYAKVFLLDDGHIAGVGRALSDGVCQASIYNIAVREDLWGRGLGKTIVDELLKQVEGCNVVLYTHPKHIGLYEHWGFKKLKTSYAHFQREEYFVAEGFLE
ncbi:MAG: GNAT family N-acetyltransferase [Clostridiales bacterium]|nr:GNAT family N-acetyltransferase [Clostridiales bacterium]